MFAFFVVQSMKAAAPEGLLSTGTGRVEDACVPDNDSLSFFQKSFGLQSFYIYHSEPGNLQTFRGFDNDLLRRLNDSIKAMRGFKMALRSFPLQPMLPIPARLSAGSRPVWCRRHIRCGIQCA